MIKLVVKKIENREVTFFINCVGGEKCRMDYFATPVGGSPYGNTELDLLFEQEPTVEKIEEVKTSLEERLNAATSGTWLGEIVAEAMQGIAGLVGQSSHVPS